MTTAPGGSTWFLQGIATVLLVRYSMRSGGIVSANTQMTNVARPSVEGRGAASPTVGPDPRRWRALALLCLAFFMVILDSSIVVVALPSIQRHLRFSPDHLQWVISAYLLAFGGLLLLGGRSADLLGRRRMFILGTGLFSATSLACGLAPSAAALIVARVVQGLAAAVMTPTALSLLMTTFEQGSERNTALGAW